MECWSYVSGVGKGFSSEESVSAADGIARGKNGLMGWELKTTPSSFGSNMVTSRQDSIENQGFGELGFPEMIRKSLPNGSIRDVFSNKVITNAFSGEEEFSSRFSSSVVESNSKDSSFIDLKLGRLDDQSDAHNFNSSETTPNLSSAGSSMPGKRARAGGLSSSNPFCQVYGCQKDLSSSKDYHKRHKVCEVHSKTAKVIVNGIEQRFCQQCSRFHLLAEFDDGKRSCRRRLSGHNERRRKPHGGIHLGRTTKFQPYNGASGSRLQGTAFTTSSYSCQGVIPSTLPHPQKYEMNDWHRGIKLEVGFDNTTSTFPISNQHLHSNSYAGSNFFSRSLFQNGSIGSEEFTFFNSGATVQGPSEISDSGHALSLLSSQTPNSSSHSSGIPAAHSLLVPRSHVHCNVTPLSEKYLGVSMQASRSVESYKFHSSGINSLGGETHFDPILISNGTDAVNFGVDGIFQGSEYVNAKDHLSCDDGPTMNLFQLSSELQRVEHQKQSMKMEQENDVFFGLRIT